MYGYPRIMFLGYSVKTKTTYKFDRNTDGYPEVAVLDTWKVRVQATNIWIFFCKHKYTLIILNIVHGILLYLVYQLGLMVGGLLGWGLDEWYGRG